MGDTAARDGSYDGDYRHGRLPSLKPKIRYGFMGSHVWWCIGLGNAARGISPIDAYRNWYWTLEPARLPEVMHQASK